MLRHYKIVGPVVLAASLLAAPTPSLAGVFVGVGVGVGFGLDVSVTVAPPPLPVYEQPPCFQPDTIWTPGYWAYGPYGYFWVPGTWVAAPQIGYLWTPGYWGYSSGAYAWHAGYWGPHVGFYGGVNYGFGYAGSGFSGGDWAGGHFRYNTAVTNVNQTNITNVYVNRSVVINDTGTTINHTSYNGGPGGIQRRPTASELAYRNEPHRAATAVQTQHLATAAQNRYFLASVNHGVPANAAVASPLSRAHRPAAFAAPTSADREAVAASRSVSRFDRPATATNSPEGSIRVRDAQNYRMPSYARTRVPSAANTTDYAPSYAHAQRAHEAGPAHQRPSYARTASGPALAHSYDAPRAYHSTATARQRSAPRAPHSTQHASEQHRESSRPHDR